MKVICRFEPEHEHEYPDDWVFGGPLGTDPAADPRFVVPTYEYYDENLARLELTSAPRCDDQAIDEFTKVANRWPNDKPTYLAVKRGGRKPFEVLQWKYDRDTDTVTPL
jgi:hypothetical protein